MIRVEKHYWHNVYASGATPWNKSQGWRFAFTFELPLPLWFVRWRTGTR